jgi:manganese oxidase
MHLLALLATVVLDASQGQEPAIAAKPRLPLPRPVANAPVASINDNRVPAGRLVNGVLTVALDIVEAAWQPEGLQDPVVRVLAFAESGKAPSVPAPLLRAPAGTEVRLTLRNRSDSALMFSGFRYSTPITEDTVRIAPGATRLLSFRLDSVGTFAYWGVLASLGHWTSREWLDSQLSGAIVVDPAGTPPGPARDRVWVVTEWFQFHPDRPFESALVFNGKAWPHTERITLTQNDSVHWRIVNLAAVPHPMHLHGFYFRVTRRGGERADTAVASEHQALENVHVMAVGATTSFSFLPTTPGGWVFHCHFADHVSEHVSLAGSPDAMVTSSTSTVVQAARSPTPSSAHGGAHGAGGHDMRGLVIGITVTPAKDHREPALTDQRTLRLFVQKEPNRLIGRRDAYGFMLQTGDSAPPPNKVRLPGPVLELRRGQPVRIVVQNNLTEPTGIHWHGLEIESYPDGVPGISGIGRRIMPPIAPGDSFVAEFTPPRSGTFPYHAHMHELVQIGSGMYGAIIVSDAPRDTTRDHLVVAGGRGAAPFEKQFNPFMLVNGRESPRPIRMVVGDTNRLRIVSIHSENILQFRLGDDSTVARWIPIAKDGADLPPARRVSMSATTQLGPGETADFFVVPARPGTAMLEVYSAIVPGARIVVPLEFVPRE